MDQDYGHRGANREEQRLQPLRRALLPKKLTSGAEAQSLRIRNGATEVVPFPLLNGS